MTHSEIEAFLAIVKYQNFSVASENLFITQPALSRRLKNLENRIGCILIARGKGNKQIELTDEGELFLPVAKRWMTLFKDSSSLTQKMANRVLTISALNGIHTCVLTKPYKVFTEEMKDCTIKIKILSSKASYYNVEEETTDLAFIAECQLSKKTTLLPVFHEKMFFASTSNLYNDDVIDPSTLDIRKCIYVQWNFEIDAWYSNVFPEKIQPLAEVENMLVLAELLKNSDNWAIVPASIASYLKGIMDIQIKTLTNPIPDRTIYCITNNNTKKKDLIDYYLKEVKKYLLTIDGIQISL